jgi:glycolate oxidase iron-sulfur subunit
VIAIEEELEKCFKCGMCRAVCPVLNQELLETFGPRGKIAICEALRDGSLHSTGKVLKLLRMCTGCRSCSMNCASQTDPRSLVLAIEAELGSPVSKAPVPNTRAGRALLEASADPYKDLKRFLSAPSGNGNEVAYFIGCVEAGELTRVPENVLMVLRKRGISVAVPPEQVCCGWPQALLGDLESARKLADQNRRVFAPYRTVLTSCVHCKIMLSRDYPALFDIHDFAGETKGLLEFIRESGLPELLDTRKKKLKTFYSRACRMGRGRERDDSHIQFLRERLSGSLVESCHDWCCGAPLEMHSTETANRMLARKSAEIALSECDLVLADCPFCVLALESICEIPVMHLLSEIDA